MVEGPGTSFSAKDFGIGKVYAHSFSHTSTHAHTHTRTHTHTHTHTGSKANTPGTDKDGWMYSFNWTGKNEYAGIPSAPFLHSFGYSFPSIHT